MQTRRLSPVVLAVAGALSLLSVQAQAQSSMEMSNGASLSKGMTPQGVRSYELPRAVTGGTANANSGNSPSSGVGTTGANGNTNTNNPGSSGNGAMNPDGTSVGTNGGSSGTGSSGNTTITGPSGLTNTSPNQYTYGPNGQLISNGGELMGPPAPGTSGAGYTTAIPGTVVGSNGLPGMTSNGQPTMDWMKIIQVAAPIVAGATGNSNLGNIASIVGSGAQVYGNLTSGADLTMQNYANMGNIALQTAAMATNNSTIDKAAQLGNLGTGAWNAYTALTPNNAGAGTMTNNATLVGYNANGQPVYQTTQPQANTGSTWGTVANAASTYAPQLGAITGNQTLGQVGAVAGAAGQLSNTVYNTQGQPTYSQGNQGYTQPAQGNVNYGQVTPGTVNYTPAQPTAASNAVYQAPKPVYDAVTGEQVLPGSSTSTSMPASSPDSSASSGAASTPKATQAEIDRFNSPLYAKPAGSSTSSTPSSSASTTTDWVD